MVLYLHEHGDLWHEDHQKVIRRALWATIWRKNLRRYFLNEDIQEIETLTEHAKRVKSNPNADEVY